VAKVIGTGYGSPTRSILSEEWGVGFSVIWNPSCDLGYLTVWDAKQLIDAKPSRKPRGARLAKAGEIRSRYKVLLLRTSDRIQKDKVDKYKV